MMHITPETPGQRRVFRGSLLHCPDGARPGDGDGLCEFIADGMIIVSGGKIVDVAPSDRLLPGLDDAGQVVDLRGRLLVPGFIDTHVHYPQTDMIASHGERLLDWLDKYALPAEMRFDDPVVCADTARFFLDELLRNGTTTACVFATVHAGSVDAFMAEAHRRNLRMIAGKVLMDRNCPGPLCEDNETGMIATQELIDRWHGRGRLAYAVTPRFAPTSSRRQLAAAGEILARNDGLYMQTHMAETTTECDWVAELFPEANGYLGVYEQAGLTGPRSVLAHCIHIDDHDRERLGESGTAIAFCPASNLFLGSGLFDYPAARRAGLRVGLGSDVGAGTHFGIFNTAAEAYKVCHLGGGALDPMEAFYLATLGGARALRLEDRLGSFAPGKEADFVVLDYNATPLIARRVSRAETLSEKIFAMFVLGDDRIVAATYILGEQVYGRDED